MLGAQPVEGYRAVEGPQWSGKSPQLSGDKGTETTHSPVGEGHGGERGQAANALVWQEGVQSVAAERTQEPLLREAWPGRVTPQKARGWGSAPFHGSLVRQPVGLACIYVSFGLRAARNISELVANDCQRA